jgi:hypothetical protein
MTFALPSDAPDMGDPDEDDDFEDDEDEDEDGEPEEDEDEEEGAWRVAPCASHPAHANAQTPPTSAVVAL